MLYFVTTVAKDSHGMLFNGSNVTMTREATKVHFSGLDWQYGRPQNGVEYLMASGPSNEDVTVAVSTTLCLSVHPYVCLSICLSVCLFICLSVMAYLDVR